MIIIAHNYVKPEALPEALLLLKQLVRDSRKENGCNAYDLYQNLQDPTHCIIMENWGSEDAMHAHSNHPHFTATTGKLIPLLAKEGAITPVRPVVID